MKSQREIQDLHGIEAIHENETDDHTSYDVTSCDVFDDVISDDIREQG